MGSSSGSSGNFVDFASYAADGGFFAVSDYVISIKRKIWLKTQYVHVF